MLAFSSLLFATILCFPIFFIEWIFLRHKSAQQRRHSFDGSFTTTRKRHENFILKIIDTAIFNEANHRFSVYYFQAFWISALEHKHYVLSHQHKWKFLVRIRNVRHLAKIERTNKMGFIVYVEAYNRSSVNFKNKNLKFISVWCFLFRFIVLVYSIVRIWCRTRYFKYMCTWFYVDFNIMIYIVSHQQSSSRFKMHRNDLLLLLRLTESNEKNIACCYPMAHYDCNEEKKKHKLSRTKVIATEIWNAICFFISLFDHQKWNKFHQSAINNVKFCYSVMVIRKYEFHNMNDCEMKFKKKTLAIK